MISEAKQGNETPPPAEAASDPLSPELEKLASLRDSGALSEQEFEQAKRRVLGQ